MAIQELSAHDIAEYFLAKVDRQAGDCMSNLKLQKLLYYAQGFHVAMHAGEPLFPESILAWKLGPVVRPVWLEYNGYGKDPIPAPPKYRDAFPPEVRELLNAVNSVYGQFEPSALTTLTHNETPWKRTTPSAVISLKLIRDFFTTLVEAGRTGKPVGREPLWPTNSFRHQRRKEVSERMAVYREKLRRIATDSPVSADQ